MMTANSASSPLRMEIPQDIQERAESVKAEANKHFQAGKYGEAERLYSEAIALNPTVVAYYLNRSFANLKLENNGYAIRDADEALRLDPTNIKALYRRATAKMAMSRFKEALKDLQTVCKYAPKDPDANTKRNELEKTVRRMDFEKAIEFQEKRASDSIELDRMIVDPAYDGERWDEDTPISDAFIADMVQRFQNQKTIDKKYAYKILLQAKTLLTAYPSLVDVRIPEKFTICGDTHGQYFDFLHIFNTNGYPSESHGYLFNGDFVDRGSFSAEVILTLLAYKLRFPETFHLSRGNHETDSMNQVYGFQGEIQKKYSQLMFRVFSEVFCALPLGFVIEKRIFVTHGGLFSRDNVTLDELRKLDRFKQPPHEGLMCEMLWADPQPENGRAPSKRGIGLLFGPDVTENFLQCNQLDMIVRSHEMKEAGYTCDHGGKCVTVFSAPNYCDQMGNKGAYINLKKKDPQDTSERPELDLDYIQFDCVPHPQNVKAMMYAGGGYRGMMGF